MNAALFTSDASPYAYLYGRVSGMTGKLFSGRDIEGLIQARSHTEVLASLESTAYEPYVSGIDAEGFSAMEIEARLSRYLRDVFGEVSRITPEREREVLAIFFTELWNYKNRKTMLRGIHHGMPKEEMQKLISPLGEGDAALLSRLAGAASVRDFLEGLGFFSFAGAAKAYKDYESSGRLEVLESFYDLAFFRGFADKLGGTSLGEYALAYADLLNIKNVLRCRRYGIEATAYLTDASLALPKTLLTKAANADFEELPALFSKTPYGGLVSDAIRRFQNEKTLSHLEYATDAYLRESLKGKAGPNPLSVYPAAYFIEAKAREIKTVKAIILSKKEGFSPEETRRIAAEVYE